MTQHNPTESNAASNTPEPIELRLHALASPALNALERLLVSEATPPDLRLRAAQAILRSINRTQRPTSAAHDMAQFDQLCQELAPHSALRHIMEP